jgi:hypothetical protein
MPRLPRWWPTITSPGAALAALVANDYKPGCHTRRFIMANIETDGGADYGIGAAVYEGPKGEQAFGAAWITAELEPMSAGDVESSRLSQSLLREALDAAAWRYFRRQGPGV